MEAKIVEMVKTRLNKDDKNAIVTALTFLTAGVTVEMLLSPALQTLVINKQGEWRRKGNIPQTEEVSIKDMIARMGSRSVTPTVEGVSAAATTFTDTQRDELIKKLQAQQKAEKAGNKGKGAKKDGDQPQA